MRPEFLAIVAAGALSSGQVLAKEGVNSVTGGFGALFALRPMSFLGAAVLAYGIAGILWIAVLRDMPISRAYPFIGITFVVVPFAGHFLSQDPLSLRGLLGAIIIFAGILLSSAG